MINRDFGDNFNIMFNLISADVYDFINYSIKHVHRERKNKVRRSSSNGHHSSGIIKEQSQSVLRGEHPIAFVLPTVTNTSFIAFVVLLLVIIYYKKTI